MFLDHIVNTYIPSHILKTLVKQYLVPLNVFFKTSIRNKLQHNAVVPRLEYRRMHCDNILMIQYMSICLVSQLTSSSAHNDSEITNKKLCCCHDADVH